MAAIFSILTALARLVWRDMRSFGSLQSNNFCIFVLLVGAQQPESAGFLVFILAGIIFVLMAEDPLAKFESRMPLWPLTRGQRVALRLGSLALSPVAWLALWAVAQTGHLRAALPVIAAVLIVRLPAFAWGSAISRAPASLTRINVREAGSLLGLFLLHVRQTLTVLDTHVAVLLCLAGTIARFFRVADAAAFPILAMVVTLALSTQTQALFGLDGTDGRARYRLFPIHGWRLLAAKTAAHLAVIICLTLPLNVLCGAASGLAALTLGQRDSVLQLIPQRRFRFAAGSVFPTGLMQIVAVFMAGVTVDRAGPLWIIVPAACCVISIWFYGRRWDAVPEGED